MNVLIVDDDRSIQRLLADTLSREGYSVSVERDGEWALRTLESRPFDLVVMETVLPSMSGFELLLQMRQLPRGAPMPALFLSRARVTPTQQREVETQYGAAALLSIPFRTSELLRQVRDLLGADSPLTERSTAPSLAIGGNLGTARTDERESGRTDEYPVGTSETDHGVNDDDDDDVGNNDRLADPDAREEVRTVEQTVRASNAFPTLRGKLSDKPFPEVLADVYRWKATGAVLVRKERVKKIVYFRDGIPQSIKSNLLSECLGRVMVRERMISEAQCDESLTRMKESGRQQGTVLIEMSCISPHNLVYALKLQMQQKLFDVFGWEEGEYQFNAKVDLPLEPINLEATTAALIYEGVRRKFEEKRLRELLGKNVDSQFVFPAESPLYALQDAGLGTEEQQFLEAADGHKTVATLRALDLLGPLGTLRFVYAMKCAQMLELRDTAAEGKPRASLLKLAEEAPRPPPLPPVEHRPSTTLPPSLPPSLPTASSAQQPPALPTFMGRPPIEVTGNAGPLAPPPLSQRQRPPVVAEPVIRSGGSLLPELSMSGVTTDDQLVRERLVRQVAEMRNKDHFQLLGVAPTASREDVKRAYFALAKEHHPDKHHGSASAEVRQLATQVYELISQAHDVLTDPEERARYERERQSGPSRGARSNDAVGQILAAESKFQKGVEQLRQRNHRAAYQAFSEALALYDQEGDFHAYLGWSLFQSEPQNPAVVDAALRSLERAVTLNPRSDKGYLFTGYVHKLTGRPDKAERHFEKAIQCNPDCTEALRELRLLGRVRR